jgi:hypothetical protein
MPRGFRGRIHRYYEQKLSAKGEGMKERINKPMIINVVLWIAFLLALGSSVSHLAWTFGTLEPPDRAWAGWIPAIAVDAGLAALAYSIQQRKRAKQSTLALWLGVAAFAIISAIANLYHALSVESGARMTLETLASIDWLQLALAIVLSATLPGMVLYMGEIVSSDDSTRLSEQEREDARAKARAEREQARLEREAATRELEARNEQARLELELRRSNEAEQAQATLAVMCDTCGRTFRNRQAKAAHKCAPVEMVDIGINGRLK